jgi:hypothetical protein
MVPEFQHRLRDHQEAGRRPGFVKFWIRALSLPIATGKAERVRIAARGPCCSVASPHHHRFDFSITDCIELFWHAHFVRLLLSYG